MPKGKATKKFEQRHLKDTLDKRNSLKKTKQKQQLKERKRPDVLRRRAETPTRSRMRAQSLPPRLDRTRLPSRT